MSTVNGAGDWRVAERAVPGWWGAIGIAGVAAVTLGLLNREALAALAALWWNSDSYGHGLLIVPISAWLVWARRARLKRLAPAPDALAIVALLGISVAWLAAALTDVMVGEQLGFLLLVLGIAWAVLGRRIMREVAFPLAYLLLAVPVWSVLIPFLRDNTALAAAEIVRFFRVPVYVEGLFINIPAGRFEIADVCAGLRFFLAALSISALYAYLSYHRLRLGALFVGVAVLWATLFNWIRVTAIVMVGYIGGMSHPIVQDHNTLGWVLFAVAMVPLFLFGNWLMGWDRAPSEAPREEAGGSSAALNARLSLVGGAAILVAFAGPVAAYWVANQATGDSGLVLRAPPGTGGWSQPAPVADPLRSSFDGADQRYAVAYTQGADTVAAAVSHYAVQRQGKELISDINALYDTNRWRLETRRAVSVSLGDGTGLRAAELILNDNRDNTWLVWYWYDVAGHATADPYLAKLWQAWGALTGNAAGSVVMLGTGVPLDARRAREAPRSFARSGVRGRKRPEPLDPRKMPVTPPISSELMRTLFMWRSLRAAR